MALPHWIRPRSKRAVARVSGFAVVATGLVAGALIYPGFSHADVDLNDGSVWVTNRSAGMVAHLNSQSKVLDGGFTATATNFDVLQEANDVFVTDAGGSFLSPVDVPMMAVSSETNLGGGKSVAASLKRLALTETGAGKVWVLTQSALPGFNDKSTTPVLTNLDNPVSTVALNGTVYTADAKSGDVITTIVDDSGKVSSQERSNVPGLAGLGELQITVAGNQPVVFAQSAGKLFLPKNKTIDVSGAQNAKLAQPTAEGNFVALETSGALMTQPLDGSAAQFLKLPTTGTAIAPVVQNNCVHAAWGGANKYVLSCGGTGTFIDIKKASAQSQFVFRKNRDVVALNDTNNGDVWLVNQNMMLVNNWDDLQSSKNPDKISDEDTPDPNVSNTLPDRTKPNRPPVAVADSFGVRAGKTSILPVLFNDSDPDGDVLTAVPPTENPVIGNVESIYGGTGLQIKVPQDASGKVSFNYTANDGRRGTNKAPVTVRVVGASENSAPTTMRETNLIVEQGQTVKQNMLADWIDPEGDDVFLTKAVSDDKSAVIKTTPDGELKYTDDGEKTGSKTMTITVSDGEMSKDKKIKVTVKAKGQVKPIANADFYRGVAGEPLLLEPLKNDQDPSGGTLRLASVNKADNGTVSSVANNSSATYTPKDTGTVYLEYQVTNGPGSAMGLIRVEVVSPTSVGLPVAVKDLAMLPSGGTVLVDVLANDMDPAGGVLVLQSVEVPGGAPVTAMILERNVIKLSDVRGLNGTLRIKYTVSNGEGSAVGEIAVVRIPAPDKILPPRVEPDKATVRVGDIVSIPVLENDVDPNGEVLKSPSVVEGIAPPVGKLFSDQNQLRFIAGPTAKTVNAVYKVSNSSGQSASAQVTITIVAADPEHNQAPAPKNLTGRVIAGDKVNIPVPLNGIDPDGDSVELVGIDKAPSLGTAEVANGYIFYTAGGSSAGTDTFTYRVRDRLGAESFARVNVGVAPVLNMNHPPVTADDYITMRPGRPVAIDVLLNDSDPDGGTIGVVKSKFSGPAAMKPGVDSKGRVVVTSPPELGIATMRYTIADKFAATATGNIRMTVTANAPLKAPIARDDRVSVKQILGRNTVDVPVLDNDVDPDGTTDAVKVSVDAVPGKAISGATVLDKGKIRVPLLPGDQMVPYTVTDQDGLKSTAVIWVPGFDKQYPTLEKKDPIRLTAGQSATMKLSDYVKVRDGRTPRLTEASKISLLGASNDNVIVGDGAGIKYASNIEFYGPGSITFEVTDGKSVDDPKGLKSTLTVMTIVDPAPIKVEDPKKSPDPKKPVPTKKPEDPKKPEKKKNTPPTFTGSMLEVPQEETVTLDVGPMAFDVDPGDKDKFKFSMSGGAPQGFKAELKGSVITASLNNGTKPGTKGTIKVQVSDGTNTPVSADVVLTATSSSEPLPVANDDTVADAHAGRAEEVKVLGNDVNPFPGTPLKVVGTSIDTDSSGVTVSNTDSTVTVKTASDYKGIVVVRYIVADKTGDKDRYANARVRITVKGKPDVPSKPQVVEELDQKVLLTWDAPADNGSPLKKYTVTWSGGSQDCESNTCTITGLTNAQGYKFSVKATNDVGTSAASEQSVTATPDRVPDTPAAPTTVYGDGQITVSWVTPVGQYSAVTAFNVEISPAPDGQNGQRPSVKGNSLVWTGLSNGTGYQFRVQAINNAPRPSEWSAYSATEIPAGKPGVPGTPDAQVAPAVGSNAQVSVSWGAAFRNGANISSYTLDVIQNGGVIASHGVQGLQKTLTMSTSTAAYQFRVRATNKAGTGGYSGTSLGARVAGKVGTPAAPTLQILNTGGAGGQVRVNYQPLRADQLNGFASNEIQYCVTLSTSSEQCGVASGTALSTPNGTNVYANVRARANGGGQSSVGDNSGASAAVTPYGVPSQVPVSGSTSGQGDKTVRWSWSAPAANGSGIARFEISLNGGAWANNGMNTSWQTTAGNYGDSGNLQVRACNAGGCGAAGSAVSTAGSAPPAPVTQWTMTNVTNDSCADPIPGTTNWQGGTCQGGKWLDKGQSMITNCKYYRSGSSLPGYWYRVVSAPNAGINGLFVRHDAFGAADKAQPIPDC